MAVDPLPEAATVVVCLPVVTPTLAPVGASSSQRQSSSDDSADDEVALQRSRRLRKKSVVESDESSNSAAEALEEKPASPLTPASVSPTPSTGQKRPSSPVAPALTKKARASASAKYISPPGPVAKSTSRVRPTAKSRKAAKSATKTARGTAKSGKSTKSADPPTPASGQSVSASGTAAVSAPTSSASSGQASNSVGGAPLLPDVLRLPILTLRTRVVQAVNRLPRAGSDEDLARSALLPFGLGALLGSSHAQLRGGDPEGDRRRQAPGSVDSVVDVWVGGFRGCCWLKCRGDRQEMGNVFVALYGRMHWLVDSSVVLGLHPDLNLTSWYASASSGRRTAMSASDAVTPCARCTSTSVPFAPPANLLWFPTSADWCEAAVDVDVGEPWQALWLRMPELHPYNMYFRPLHPGFPVFGSAESDLSHVQRLVDEAVDLAESAPPTCSPSAPTPANREGLDIFGSSEASPDATL
ncbi:unnamed protein product [Phytophthora fragariaefolia]|uniref:Unnamed protein product n=1 Tax=Phytophthora fragariaefolia TaxID=1490495 RepID=A0A9W6Y5H1_9STRA|nr:unnamed protein product [Phytophthora fragariaefolia]